MRQKKRLIWGFLGLLTVLAYTCFGVSAGKAAPIGTAIGNRAPGFELMALNKRSYRLKTVISQNRVTLVNFWATWCGPCRGEIPELIRFYNRYSRRKVALLAVNLQEKPGEVRKFVRKAGINFPVLPDTTGRIAAMYNVYAIPTTFIVDGKGIIRKVIEGSTTLAALETQVKAILKEKK
jgi:thiol-disulfide isomerase/thioredoxin